MQHNLEASIQFSLDSGQVTAVHVESIGSALDILTSLGAVEAWAETLGGPIDVVSGTRGRYDWTLHLVERSVHP